MEPKARLLKDSVRLYKGEKEIGRLKFREKKGQFPPSKPFIEISSVKIPEEWRGKGYYRTMFHPLFDHAEKNELPVKTNVKYPGRGSFAFLEITGRGNIKQVSLDELLQLAGKHKKLLKLLYSRIFPQGKAKLGRSKKAALSRLFRSLKENWKGSRKKIKWMLEHQNQITIDVRERFGDHSKEHVINLLDLASGSRETPAFDVNLFALFPFMDEWVKYQPTDRKALISDDGNAKFHLIDIRDKKTEMKPAKLWINAKKVRYAGGPELESPENPENGRRFVLVHGLRPGVMINIKPVDAVQKYIHSISSRHD